MEGSILERYKNILDLVPCGICQVALDDDLTILYANRFYYDIYGYTPQNAEEQGFINVRFILPEEEYPEIHRKVLDYAGAGTTKFQMEFRGKHRTGKVLWLLVQCTYNPDTPEYILCSLMDIGDRKRMEEEIRMSMEENRIAFELTNKQLYIYDIENKRLFQPESAAEEFGLPPVAGYSPYSIVESGVIAEESRQEYIDFYESMIDGDPRGYAVVKKRKKDGTFGWYSAKSAVIYDREGKPCRAVISCENITEQREKELTYQKWSQYFKSQEGKTIGYYEYNLTKDVVEAGDDPPVYLKLLNKYTETVRYIAERFVYEGDRARFYHFFNRDRMLMRYYSGQTDGTIDYLRKREDGSLYWVRATIQLIGDPYNNDVRLFMMTLNIDEEKTESLRLQHKMECDGMTDILNRDTFMTRVTEILEKSSPDMRHALIMLDIDQFKLHNDSYGHQFGDYVIRETAQILKRFLRKNDSCGRIGGDEFMVFLNDIKSEQDIIPRIAELCSLLKREYPEKGEVSCSLGVVFYPRNG
ncbi:sensor domain-containing diguanylate cyclase, partial [Hungatella hathewayi]